MRENKVEVLKKRKDGKQMKATIERKKVQFYFFDELKLLRNVDVDRLHSLDHQSDHFSSSC